MVVRVMVLGGYGGTGRLVSRRLLEQLSCEVVVAGRDLERARAHAAALATDFPGRVVRGARVDATDATLLTEALRSIDLLVITTTTPDAIPSIVRAALATHTDTIDVLFRADVYQRLAEMQSEIAAAGRVVVTQAGCHPGLVSPLVRHAARGLATLRTARVFMAFGGASFDSAAAARELLEECASYSGRVLEGGAWRAATYRDSAVADLGATFGKQECFPVRMLELEALDAARPGLESAGSYAAGFNWLTDFVLMPAAMVLGRRSVGALTGAFNWGVRTFGTRGDGVVFRAEVEGTRAAAASTAVPPRHHGRPADPSAPDPGARTRAVLTVTSADAYDFTAAAVASCAAQLLDGTIRRPGLHLMGSAVEPARTLADLEGMGARVALRSHHE